MSNTKQSLALILANTAAIAKLAEFKGATHINGRITTKFKEFESARADQFVANCGVDFKKLAFHIVDGWMLIGEEKNLSNLSEGTFYNMIATTVFNYDDNGITLDTLKASIKKVIGPWESITNLLLED